MNIHDPYLEFNFITSTIILNHIEITGANGSYVKDIQIETDMYGNGNFEFVRDAQTNTAQVSCAHVHCIDIAFAHDLATLHVNLYISCRY